MRNVVIALSVMSVLLIVTMLICGLWISHMVGVSVDLNSPISFLKTLAIGAGHSTVITLALVIVRK